MPPAIGMGQGVVRLLAFSAILATENPSVSLLEHLSLAFLTVNSRNFNYRIGTP